MKRIACLVCCWLLLTAAARAGSVETSQFRYAVDVTGTVVPDTPVKLTLSEEVVSMASLGFKDLRLFDDRGMEVPYVIYNEIVPGEKETSFVFKVRSFESADSRDVVILERPEVEQDYNNIDIKTPARDFKKEVRIYTSNGQGDEIPGAWQFLKSDSIFDVSSQIDLRKTVIEMPGTGSRYLKLEIISDGTAGEGKSIQLKYDGLEFRTEELNREPFRINRVSSTQGVSRAGKPVLDWKVVSKPDYVTDDNNDSIFELGLVDLPVIQVRLEVGRKYFHRSVKLLGAVKDDKKEYKSVGSGTIYRIPDLDKFSNSISSSILDERYLKLKVINGDNSPLDISKIELAWPRANLFFIPEKERSYTLNFGVENISKPEYEVGRIIKNNHEKLSTYSVLLLKKVRTNPGYVASKPATKKEITERAIFKIIIILLVLGLAWWLFNLMKKLPAANGEE